MFDLPHEQVQTEVLPSIGWLPFSRLAKSLDFFLIHSWNTWKTHLQTPSVVGSVWKGGIVPYTSILTTFKSYAVPGFNQKDFQTKIKVNPRPFLVPLFNSISIEIHLKHLLNRRDFCSFELPGGCYACRNRSQKPTLGVPSWGASGVTLKASGVTGVWNGSFFVPSVLLFCI